MIGRQKAPSIPLAGFAECTESFAHSDVESSQVANQFGWCC